jgi:hypothetical protein
MTVDAACVPPVSVWQWQTAYAPSDVTESLPWHPGFIAEPDVLDTTELATACGR